MDWFMPDIYWQAKGWQLWWDFAVKVCSVFNIGLPARIMLLHFCRWTSTRIVTLGDAQEFIAVDNLVFQLVNQTFLGQALSRYVAPDVKIYTTPDPNIKVVSFVSFNLLCCTYSSWPLITCTLINKLFLCYFDINLGPWF